MAQQTPIQWLLERVPMRYRNALMFTCEEELKEAEEMHQKQIEEAWKDGNFAGRNGGFLTLNEKDYYKETFKK